MKKLFDIVIVLLVAVIIIARIFFPFTPIWLDAFFILCIVIFFILTARNKNEDS